MPFNFTITPTGESAGTIVFASSGQDPQSVPLPYTDGTIHASMSQKGAAGTITLTMSEDVSTYAAAGTMKNRL